jgi:hypothetical protein
MWKWVIKDVDSSDVETFARVDVVKRVRRAMLASGMVNCLKPAHALVVQERELELTTERAAATVSRVLAENGIRFTVVRQEYVDLTKLLHKHAS